MENWTIEELAERVADALAAGYPGQPSARVREVPDRRTIRWYTTTGLVDRPAAMRGRTALYGRRHLLQLVAIKRLQAQGRSLAAIQEQLLNADDRALEHIAALPPASPGSREDVAGAPSANHRRGRGRAEAPGHPEAHDAEAPGNAEAPGRVEAPGNAGVRGRVEAPGRARFWAAPAQPAAQPAALDPPPAGLITQPAVLPEPSPGRAAPDLATPLLDGAAVVPAIRLGGVTLLLDSAHRTPTPGELAALRTAATPLLDLLHQLDLTEGTP